jgi:hypothetical protein
MIDPTDTVTLPLTGIEPRWLDLLRKAVQAEGRGGVTKVAARLLKPSSSPSSVGKTYVRSYVSQVLHGLLPLDKISPHFQASVIAAFGQGRIECPHLKTDIALGECQTYAAVTWGQVANTGYERLDHWKACDKCLQNPVNQSTPKAST